MPQHITAWVLRSGRGRRVSAGKRGRGRGESQVYENHFHKEIVQGILGACSSGQTEGKQLCKCLRVIRKVCKLKEQHVQEPRGQRDIRGGSLENGVLGATKRGMGKDSF